MIKPSDIEARKRISEDLETTFVVEAGAGSGKTTSLVGRMVSLIRTGTARVDQLAAITFTNKAADELKERFRLDLERSLQVAGDQEKTRLSAALECLDQGFIGTIHAFCGMLLRERPVEAGVDPAFRELDEQAEMEQRSRCWDEYVQLLTEEGKDGELQELRQYGIHVNTLKGVYERVSLFTDVRIEAADRPQPDFDMIRLSLPRLVDEAWPYLPVSEPEKGWDALQRALRTVKQKERNLSWDDDRHVLQLAAEFDKKLDVTLNRWVNKAKAKELKERFQEWQVTVLFPLLQSWREFLYPKLICVVLPAVAYSERKRLEAGFVSFQDLLMKAASMLREAPEVRRYFANRYQRLLVDEFQDTDPIQAEMMFLLTGRGEDPEEKDWRKLQPRPGSLFIVGDPKQSIYRFRRADISIYNEVKSRVRACGDVLQLNANFRSVQAIGDYVNYQFGTKFPKETSEQQAAFVTMETQIPNPGTKKKPAHGVYTLAYPKLPGGKAAVAAEDAKRIAAYIAWASRDGNLKIQERDSSTSGYVLRAAVPSDFLILTKTREFIGLYAEVLDHHGVPAETTGSAVLYEEILSLSQLAACLADPSDKVALLAVLRGPFFGASDRELLTYKQEGHSLHFLKLPQECGGASDADGVREALTKLRSYYGWTRKLPAMTALYRMLEDMGLLLYTALQEAGATRAGTLLKLLQLLQDNPDTAADWGALAEALKEWTTGKGVEASSLYAGRGQAVRIMNLHKSKGLEAPVVFLACPCGETDHDAAEHIDRSQDPAAGYFTISQRKFEYVSETLAQPIGWETIGLKEREFMNAEKDRLLYVSATRAKQLLVISQYPEQPVKCPWSPLMEGMEWVPELEIPDIQPQDAGQYDGHPDIDLFQKERSAILEQLEQPTYAHVSVTGLTKMAADIPEWSSEGHGMTFGSLVHQGIEAVGKGLSADALKSYMQMIGAQLSLTEEMSEEACRTVAAVIGSALWQRALRAKTRLHEVRVMVRKKPGEIGLTESSGNSSEEVVAAKESVTMGNSAVSTVFLEGVIDFLFEEEEGWVMVDFKTDRFDEDKEESFLRFYKPQVMAYAKEWSETFGYKVKEAGLYFTHPHKYVPLTKN
ncbi:MULTISPECIES: UvrD-helicase domain-containing protein [unclassified Paenibacillus]|uniref:UvrD-helicase domain-containing protein n=1 Tax=unclassified Paenibacillus TaxID=185978 RepID=UPI001AE25340|nr:MULTISPECIES: UvrD-helicase domain-containing protein [unclassified Paenibacillus]MBP1154503.1 ATP-dependent helicase/nuclease subunit A [Paenibacillus sp. PvP091]MBP1170113.1 ATP-dependent helicase/nuclease subunit A [Paenibacillus sp. PvR098]MBP2441141.1 ATP-dependent helicase/nuclease subunit A [Paenibacillus sp. PvP052]